jgi:hypothetical protein
MSSTFSAMWIHVVVLYHQTEVLAFAPPARFEEQEIAGGLGGNGEKWAANQ